MPGLTVYLLTPLGGACRPGVETGFCSLTSTAVAHIVLFTGRTSSEISNTYKFDNALPTRSRRILIRPLCDFGVAFRHPDHCLG